MKPAGYIALVSIAAAMDLWLSNALVGPARVVWISVSNLILFAVFVLVLLKLRRDVRTAERGLMGFTREAVSLYSLQGFMVDMNEGNETLAGYVKAELQGE